MTAATTTAFQQNTAAIRNSASSLMSPTALYMADNLFRAARSASADDNVVEMVRPLGLVLNQDEVGNVYVEKVAPKGNAARTGKVSQSSSMYSRI